MQVASAADNSGGFSMDRDVSSLTVIKNVTNDSVCVSNSHS
jgi:hypothetical protein